MLELTVFFALLGSCKSCVKNVGAVLHLLLHISDQLKVNLNFQILLKNKIKQVQALLF